MFHQYHQILGTGVMAIISNTEEGNVWWRMLLPVRNMLVIMIKGTIMLVDDSPGNLQVLESMLTQNGYKVRPATSGPLALKAAQTVVPDLILLDILIRMSMNIRLCETRVKHLGRRLVYEEENIMRET